MERKKVVVVVNEAGAQLEAEIETDDEAEVEASQSHLTSSTHPEGGPIGICNAPGGRKGGPKR